VRAYVRACMHACVRACMCACKSAYVSACLRLSRLRDANNCSLNCKRSPYLCSPSRETTAQLRRLWLLWSKQAVLNTIPSPRLNPGELGEGRKPPTICLGSISVTRKCIAFWLGGGFGKPWKLMMSNYKIIAIAPPVATAPVATAPAVGTAFCLHDWWLSRGLSDDECALLM